MLQTLTKLRVLMLVVLGACCGCSQSEGPAYYPFKTIIPVAGAIVLVQGLVEIIRCVICIKRGAWPSREADVQEVDVDKLKEMVHVKDEDIQKLDTLVVRREAGK